MTPKHLPCLIAVLLMTGPFGRDLKAQADPIFTKKAVFGSLSDRWELDSATRKGTFRVTPYKPLYVTAGRWSSDPNEQPVSENPAYNYPLNDIILGRYEARWQLSLKVKVLQGIFGKNGDL